MFKQTLLEERKFLLQLQTSIAKVGKPDALLGI